MKLIELLKPDRIVLGLRAADKAQALGEVVKRASAQLPIEGAAILAALIAREQLGSTGFGKGFALPHVRLPGLPSMFGMLVRLARPIDYDAIDQKPVDILFVLLIPVDKGSEHVAALAAISRTMREKRILDLIRRAGSPVALFELLTAADRLDRAG